MSKVESKSKAKSSKKIQQENSDEVDMKAILAQKENEIAELNEKIRQLTIENENLQSKIPAKKRGSVIVVEPTSSPRTPRITKQVNRRKSLAPVDSNGIESPINSRLSSTAGSTKSSSKEKGCSCKGGCKTKICGCVKKGKHCSEACKCTEICENLQENVFDENKENHSGNQEDNDIKQEQEDFFTDDNEEEEPDPSPKNNGKMSKKKLENQYSESSNGSLGSVISDSSQTDAEEFNPMKPTKTLARSPLPNQSLSSSMVYEQSTLAPVAVNKKLSPVIINKQQKTNTKKHQSDSSDSEGRRSSHVDWDQHQNALVPCAKCSRKFWPDRLPVHEKSCLKI